MKIWCENCDEETDHKHLHDTAHGIPETHMAGSERYECSACGRAIFKEQAAVRNLNLRFVLD